LSDLRQISTKFDIFWQKNGKEANIMLGALILTSFNSHQHTTALNADVPNCCTMLKVVICNKRYKVLTKTILHSFLRHSVQHFLQLQLNCSETWQTVSWYQSVNLFAALYIHHTVFTKYMFMPRKLQDATGHFTWHIICYNGCSRL